LSTIRTANVIFVISDCALAEQGTHDELMARKGVYAELHALQNPSNTDQPSPAVAIAR
jgi:ABC-type multidrug transport system fused ATPase/permease subunit